MVRERPSALAARSVPVAATIASFVTLAAAGPLMSQTSPPGAVQTERSDSILNVDNPIYYHLRASDLLDEEGTAPEHLLRRFMERHTASDYMAAAEAAHQLVQVAGDRPIAHYNLACAMARLGRTDKAIESLNDAVACGWRNVGHTQRDWDLASIRHDPRYDEVIQWMRELLAREQPPSGPLRTDSVEAVVQDLVRESPRLLDRYHVPGAAIVVLREGEVAWSGSFNQGRDDVETDDPQMTARTIFRSDAPARLAAALAASDRMSKGDITVARLMVDHLDGQLAARSLGGPDGNVGMHEQGTLVGLRPAERSARNAALSGEALLPTVLGWPATSVEPTNFQLYCIAVESQHQGTSFRAFCEDRVFAPYGLDSTKYELSEEWANLLVTGHSLLGTPLQHDATTSAEDMVCFTSAHDLGRMLELLMSGTQQAGRLDHTGLVNTLQQLSKIVPGAGLGIDVQVTDDGVRVQLAEEQNGTGCLIRWYPETGDGVVIAFNAEAGPSAALRLAGIALGGRN